MSFSLANWCCDTCCFTVFVLHNTNIVVFFFESRPLWFCFLFRFRFYIYHTTDNLSHTFVRILNFILTNMFVQLRCMRVCSTAYLSDSSSAMKSLRLFACLAFRASTVSLPSSLLTLNRWASAHTYIWSHRKAIKCVRVCVCVTCSESFRIWRAWTGLERHTHIYILHAHWRALQYCMIYKQINLWQCM